MSSPLLTHDLVGHAAVQGTVFATVVGAPASLLAPITAAVVGAVVTWLLQQLGRGLWRQISRLESQVAELQALGCPYGQVARDQCAARPAPSPPPQRSD